MVVTEIERIQTAGEKSDFVLLGTKSVFDRFNEKLAGVNLEYNKKFKPFDVVCARMDFKDKVEQVQRESQRVYGFAKEDMEINFGDLDRYGDEKRFELVEDQEDREAILVNGLRTHVIVSHTLSYKCRERGHGLSVCVPIVEYNEKFGKEKK